MKSVLIAGLLAAVAVPIAPTVHAQNVDGYTFTATIDTKINGESTGAPTQFKGSVAGKNGRLNVVVGGSGSYLLTNDGGKTFWEVDDAKKEAVHLSVQASRAEIKRSGAALKNVSQSAPKPTGTGVTVGEIATKRYRVSLRHTLVIGKPDVIVMKTVETRDYDLASASVVMPPFNPAVSFLLISNPANLVPTANGSAKPLPVGFPLCMTIKSVLTANNIAKHTETTLSCDAPVKASLSASLFVLPKGYKHK